MMSPEARFFSKVDKSSSCWLWTGTKNNYGYGRLIISGKPKAAHRFSWEIHHGNIPDGMLVCHSCDTPACVNPSHLFIGTDADNIKDKCAKGRQSRVSHPGEANPRALLSAEQVSEIRQLCACGLSQRKAASKYGVSKSTIGEIMRGKNWRAI